MTINKQIVLTFFLLTFSIVFFAISDIDIFVQDYFFDSLTNTWILDRDLIYGSGVEYTLKLCYTTDKKRSNNAKKTKDRLSRVSSYY